VERNPWMFLILLLVLGAPVGPGPVSAADVLDFAVITPGQPGSPREAQPVMDTLAAYVQKNLGPEVIIKGRYFNEREPALDFLQRTPPRWGIVSLGIYAEHAGRYRMIPIASTRPAGAEKDRWRLAVGRNGPDDWKALQGTVRGTILYEKEAASCLLFGNKAKELPFSLAGTFQPLRSLRSVAGGKAGGVVLDRLQYDALKALSLGKRIKIIHESKELPTTPVVWFGPPEERMNQLAALFAGMGKDPEAKGLLRLLQTDGFGPSDPDLPGLRLPDDAGCSP
jgi:hypothetical protein